jgi:HEAT repeat protein
MDVDVGIAEADMEIDLRIQALGSLMRVEPARAVPILKEVALKAWDAEQARRAIFVLVQSNRRDAQTAVAEIARSGPEPVTVAAVRELGFLGTPYSSRLLRDLYGSGSERVKAQVIRSLGEAGAAQPLMEIARAEASRALRENAIVALGRAGARSELQRLYRTLADREAKGAVITALFTAAGEEELARIVREERDASLKQMAASRLELLKLPMNP